MLLHYHNSGVAGVLYSSWSSIAKEVKEAKEVKSEGGKRREGDEVCETARETKKEVKEV